MNYIVTLSPQAPDSIIIVSDIFSTIFNISILLKKFEQN